MSKAKVIHKDGLFVRKDKSRSSEWVRIIPCGEEFEFYEEYKGWLKVADGWVVCNDVYIQPTEVTVGGGGVSSWNDLTDKPFGEETVIKRIVIYPETELVFEVEDGYARTDMNRFDILYEGEYFGMLEAGDRIELVYDGISAVYEMGYGNMPLGDYTVEGGMWYGRVGGFCVNESYGTEDGSTHKVAINKIETRNVTTCLEEKYIRAFDKEVEVLLNETEFDFGEEMQLESPFEIKIEGGVYYTVVWDGVPYECVGYEDDHVSVIGDEGNDMSPNHNNEPFYIVGVTNGPTFLGTETKGKHTIAISKTTVKLVEASLPDTVVRASEFQALVDRVAALEAAN